MFADTFKKVHAITADDDAHSARRINGIAQLMELNETDAFRINEALDRALRESFVALGGALDSLDVRLRIEALPLVLERIPQEMAILNYMVVSMVLLGDKPTPGCDCESCQQKALLLSELSALQTAGEALGG